MTSPWFGTFTLINHSTHVDISIEAPPWNDDELLFRIAMRRGEQLSRIVRVWRDDDPPRLIGGWVPHMPLASE